MNWKGPVRRHWAMPTLKGARNAGGGAPSLWQGAFRAPAMQPDSLGAGGLHPRLSLGEKIDLGRGPSLPVWDSVLEEVEVRRHEHDGGRATEFRGVPGVGGPGDVAEELPPCCRERRGLRSRHAWRGLLDRRGRPWGRPPPMVLPLMGRPPPLLVQVRRGVVRRRPARTLGRARGLRRVLDLQAGPLGLLRRSLPGRWGGRRGLLWRPTSRRLPLRGGAAAGKEYEISIENAKKDVQKILFESKNKLNSEIQIKKKTFEKEIETEIENAEKEIEVLKKTL